MGNAVLDGVPFRLDPTSISWDFTVSTNEVKTIGGMVVQIFGAKLGDLVVEGEFGIEGWQGQQAFLTRMVALGEKQLDRWPAENNPPFRFVWPDRGWDFSVWLKSFTEPGSSQSVRASNINFNPKWQLTLFITDDNVQLKKVSEDAYLQRLFAGIGWQKTGFNGPLGFGEVQAALAKAGVNTITEYFNVAYGLVQPNTSSPAGTTQTAVTEGQKLTMEGVAAAAKSAGFSGESLAIAIAVAMAESGGRSVTSAPNSDGSYDRGLWQINSVHTQYDAARLISDVNYNAQAAWEISGGGVNWSPWYTYEGAAPHNGSYKQFMDAARQIAGV